MTQNDKALDNYFDAARRSDAMPRDDLMARVMADAATVSAQIAAPERAIPREPFWVRWMDVLGGWPALGGVMAAGLAGLWVGVAPPEGVEDWAAGIVGSTETVSIYMDLTDVGLEAQDG